MIHVTDQRDDVAAVRVAPRLGVHLRDEWADRVNDDQAALLAALLHRRRDAVRREHTDRAGRDLVLVVDEHRAEPLEPPDDVVVVDDLVADVDRWPVLGEQYLDDLDRTVDAGAEGARSGQQHLLHGKTSATAPSRPSARRASEAARATPRGSRTKARTSPRQS